MLIGVKEWYWISIEYMFQKNHHVVAWWQLIKARNVIQVTALSSLEVLKAVSMTTLSSWVLSKGVSMTAFDNTNDDKAVTFTAFLFHSQG